MRGRLRKANSSGTSRDDSAKLMEELRDFIRSRGSEYLKDQNITSVGIGYRKKNGKPKEEIAIQFTVKQKTKPEQLESLNTILIPKSIDIGGVEVVTDVIQRKFAAEYQIVSQPKLGDKVVKSGHNTRVTHGVVSRIHTVAKIDYGGSTGEQEVEGFEIELDRDTPIDKGEVSMGGGDFGSVWLFRSNAGKPTNIMAGLHLAGEGPDGPNEHAIACYSKSIFEKLEISLPPPDLEAVTKTGFNPDFLSFRIDHPKLTSSKQEAFILNGSEVIDYTHFSLSLNKMRGFAIWVGWNIDGGKIRRLPRKGISFVLDPRVPKKYQVGKELYEGNPLDQGHIARRADLVWGELAEAKKANKDSFFFTNIAPQMENFNRSKLGGLWGYLEDAVFGDTDVEDLRVSVFGGPVFYEDDRELTGIKLPREFWKVIVFIEDQKLKAKAFLLTQNLDHLEAFELDEFKVFQVALTEIESRCGFTFDPVLKAADSIGERLSLESVALSQRKPLASLHDIDWS